jgi:hypothetical protein
LPESLWDEKRQFFNSFGFMKAVTARQQYRPGETELSCSAPLTTMWTRALRMMPDLDCGGSVRSVGSQHKERFP